jgi:hypothetical protein
MGIGIKARPDETLTIRAPLRDLRWGQELLNHLDRPAQVDLNFARYVVQVVASLIEVQVSYDPGVINERIERRKLG